MIRGLATSLTQTQQAQVSRWVVKTAMTYELARNDISRDRDIQYFSQTDAKMLMEGGGVPDDTLVFLAKYVGSHVDIRLLWGCVLDICT